MRLVLPIGSPEFIGSTNYRLTAASGNFLMVGKDASLIYTPTSGGTFDPRTLNATNTGAVLGGTFTTSNPGTITTPGTYTNIRFTGQVIIQTSASTKDSIFLFRNCIFSGTNNIYNQVLIPDSPVIPTGVFFEYCTFDDGGVGVVNGIAGAFNTATRCWFKGFNNCINFYDPCTVIECANDGLMNDNPNHDAHFDCIENNGAPNCLIQRCKWINNQGQTSAIMLNNYGGSCSNNTIDNCYLEGGGYTCYADNTFSSNPMTNIRFTRNIIKSGFYGPTAFYGSDVYFPTTGPDANTII